MTNSMMRTHVSLTSHSEIAKVTTIIAMAFSAARHGAVLLPVAKIAAKPGAIQQPLVKARR